MGDLDQQEAIREHANEVREGMIDAEYETICGDVGLMEEVIETYKSCLANVWVKKRANVNTTEFLYEELHECILLEAEVNVDNQLS